MELTRRAFLGLTGLIATTAGAVESFIKYKLLGLPPPAEDELLSPREPDVWRPSVCQLCPAGCGVMARVVQGRVVKLEGLPAHPVNRGTLCPRGLAGLTELCHPDRVVQPMRRVGTRGEGEFEPIPWEDAIRLVVERLRDIRQRREPQRVAWLSGVVNPASRQLIRRFLRAFGSPHYLELGWPTGELPLDAFRAMVDPASEPIYDLAQANLIISFGLDWLQAYPSPVEASRAYSLLRRGQPDRRVRIVQIEPRFSVTAAKSDEWIPVRPGQEGLVALGIAHILIRERLFDERFVNENASGFEAFAHVAASQARPETVSEQTGISPETLHQLAMEFGLKKGLALGTRADLVTQWAVMSLNGLVGNLDARGGLLRRWEPPGLSSFSEELEAHGVERGQNIPPLTSAEALPEHLLAQEQPPLEVLFISHTNPCFLSPSPSRWVTALKRLPFIVSVASFLDETAVQADLVLPLTSAIEQWQFVPAVASDGAVVVAVSQPVVKPRGETRPLEEIVLQLTHALGDPIAQTLPWTSLEQLVTERAQALYEGKQGLLLPQVILPGRPMPEEEEPPTSFEEFWEQLLARGGLVWPSEQAPWPEFRTPSGRFELFPPSVIKVLEASPAAFGDGEGHRQAGDPLQLYLYTPLAFLNGYGAHLPFLQQIAGAQFHEAWETWVEMNPKTAKPLGVRNGDWVWVESSHGRVKAKARWYEGIAPEVVAMPLGLGHTAHGGWAKGIGENPAQLIGPQLDEQIGQPPWQGTWVKVWRA